MRKIAIVCGVLGAIFVAASLLLAFWITPTYVARLQDNANIVRNYNGTVRTLLNPAALRSGNLSGAITTGASETLRRQVTVKQTAGNTALVRDTTTATVAGRQIGGISSNYAISRTTFQATATHPSNWSITKATGQTFNWPIGAKRQNYTGWVPQTETTVPLRYVGQQPQGGINTNVYQANVPLSPIKNPQLLASLPTSLPVSLLPGAVKAGLISPSLVASLAKAFPGAKTVPLGYAYTNTAKFWVAPPTGVVVNEKLTEIEMGGVKLPSGKLVPVFPVLSDSYAFTSSSVSGAVSDANNGSSTINTWGIVVPIVVGIVGFLLLAAAAMLWIRGRRHGVGGPPHAARGPSMDPAHADSR